MSGAVFGTETFGGGRIIEIYLRLCLELTPWGYWGGVGEWK